MRTIAWRWVWRRRRRARILLIDDFVPNAMIGAGVPRLIQLLRALHESSASVTLLPRAMGALDQSFMSELASHGAEVLDGNEELGQFLAERRVEFDALLVSRPHNMMQVREVMRVNPGLIGNATLIYDAEALFGEREILMREVRGKPLKAGKAKNLLKAELNLADGAHIVIAVSEIIASAFRRAGHQDVRVLGHALAPQPTAASFESRHDFLSVGQAFGDTSPNADAVVWFVDQVLPHLRRELGYDVALHFAGAVSSPAMQARIGQGIIILGRVPELSTVYDRARVFVAATRYASGIPHKVHEAAARGVPCVVTPLLAQQIGWTPDQDVLVAATPEEFANACIALYTDKALWTRVRAAALARVAGECNPRQFDRVVGGLVRSVVKRRR